MFTAFAVAGLQGASAQTYYSLVVDQIIFGNGNTVMNFTMNYNNPDGSVATTWTNIKLSWVAVSTLFEKYQTTGQYVWAGSVGMTAPFASNIAGAVIPNSLWDNVPDAAVGTLNGGSAGAGAADAACGYIDGATPYFDV